MRALKNRVALVAIFALVFATTPGLVIAGTDARIEGMVIGADGTPAAGYSVLLIDVEGEAQRVAETDQDGVYTFAGLQTGEYALGIESPTGETTPVAAPPVKLGERQLARRDVRLYQSQIGSAPINYSGGLGLWWAGLSAGAKAGTIIALLAVVGYGTSELLDNDDEANASPTTSALN